MPQKDAGWRIEPPVSEPREYTAKSAATAAADPPLEPPGTQSGFQGFCVAKKAEFSVVEPIANSSIFVLPSKTKSFSFSFSTTVALYCGLKPFKISDAQVVLIPSVHRLSFNAIGIPASIPIGSPAASLPSTVCACFSANSSVIVI